ncbi:helix-turn-helix domain-containing protein [Morganella morganii]|nr:helix-turn-helix domain-containing protein [Morganella morganii]
MPTTPETIIQFTLQKMRQRLQNEQQSHSGSIRSGLVFAGNIHDAIPRQLLLEHRLSPFDKLTWMMIRLYAQQNSGAVFPTYDELQLQLATPHSHKASRETISRALLMLRLTGWLSLCHRVRDRRGRIRGNIYMLHDEPVNPFDAETLDPRWMDVLEKSAYHKNKSVRSVAQVTLTALKTDPTMRHQHTRMALIEQRMGAIQTPEQLANRQRLIIEPEKTQKKGLEKNRTQYKNTQSENRTEYQKGEKNPSSKIELSAQTQSGSMVRKSNCYVRNSFTQSVKNTYVDQDNQNLTQIHMSTPHSPHQLPDNLRLEPKDRDMLESQLRLLPNAIAAAIVEQLSQGIRTGTVRNPVGYMLQLLKSARDGRYNVISRTEKGKIPQDKRAIDWDTPNNPTRKVAENTEPRGQKCAPEVARKHILNIRRRLAGLSDEYQLKI